MRKVLLVSALFAACVTSAQNTFELHGTHAAPDGTKIYLINLDSRDTLGVTAVKAGQFSFTVSQPQTVYTYVGYDRIRIHFIMEPGVLNADLDQRTASGTPMVDDYNAFHRRFYGYDKQRNDERKALTARKDSIDPADFNRQWDEINDKYRQLQGQLTDSIISRNRDNLVGALALDEMALRDTVLFMKLFHGMSPDMQSFHLLSNDAKNITERSRTAPGKMFTDYLIPGGNIDGTDVRLSDYVGRGKYILLDHWASWCGPCKAEMPHIKRVWQDFAGERFDVVSIALNDKREKTLQALQTLDMPWHQIVDAQNIPGSLYNISAIPHIILFAPDGIIMRRDLRGEQIYSTVKLLLDNK